MGWNNLDQFPKSNGEWQVLDRTKKVATGETLVRTMAAKWFPLSTTLYATPNSHRFLLAICVPEIADYVHQRFASKFRVYIWLFAISLLVVVGASVVTNDFGAFAKTFSVLGIAFVYCLIEYNVYVKSYSRLRDHALFYYWVLSAKNMLLWVLGGIALCSGIVQLVYQTWYGDLDELVVKFGIYYSSANSGEWWRYLYGSFIHKNFLHWSVNFAMLMIAAGLAGPFSNRTQLISFFVILTASAIAAQFPLIGENPEGFVGISGGVFGLFGWVVGNGFRNRRLLPEDYYVHVFVFSLANLVLPVVFDLDLSFMAHATGFVIGLLFGALGISSKLEDSSK